MIKDNFLKKKLLKNEEVLGTWITIPSTIVTDIIRATGLDFIVIDMEHGPMSYETAQLMTITCESSGVSPVIRVAGVYENEIIKALDIGAHCVHIPNIKTIDEVKNIITYSKYPPLGNRGFSPFTRAFDYTIKNSSKMNIINLNTLLVIHIEEIASIDKLEEMLKEKIDIVFIGLFDISKCIGLPGQINHKKVQRAFKGAVEKVQKLGKIVGTIVTNPQMLKEVRDIGCKYITYLADCEILKMEYQKIKFIFESLRQI